MNAHDVALELARRAGSPVERVALLLIARRIESDHDAFGFAVAVFNLFADHFTGSTVHQVPVHAVPSPVKPDPRTVN
jgi:hypothetical protein